MKDSVCSVDLFRCESIFLKTYWVLVVMDQFTRRIIGFGVHVGDLDGIALYGDTPAELAGIVAKLPIKLNKFRWQTRYRGIYQLPVAA